MPQFRRALRRRATIANRSPWPNRARLPAPSQSNGRAEAERWIASRHTEGGLSRIAKRIRPQRGPSCSCCSAFPLAEELRSLGTIAVLAGGSEIVYRVRSASTQRDAVVKRGSGRSAVHAAAAGLREDRAHVLGRHGAYRPGDLESAPPGGGGGFLFWICLRPFGDPSRFLFSIRLPPSGGDGRCFYWICFPPFGDPSGYFLWIRLRPLRDAGTGRFRVRPPPRGNALAVHPAGVVGMRRAPFRVGPFQVRRCPLGVRGSPLPLPFSPAGPAFPGQRERHGRMSVLARKRLATHRPWLSFLLARMSNEKLLARILDGIPPVP
jgi:hypothetical protein